MSIMPPLPTRLVSNIKFRIYTKKAWESYIFARPDAQASHASLSRTRSMQRPTHIRQHPLSHEGTMGESCLYTQASTAASHDRAMNCEFERQSKR